MNSEIINWLRRIIHGYLPLTNNEARKIERNIMAELSELAGILSGISDRIDKAQAEITAEIAALKAALSTVAIPADAQASLDRLAAQAQALDDLNPDVVTTTTPPPAV